jgi:hypothetical protein
MELSLLDTDVATLISRGDSLVLQVQKVDLERALRINTTTGELRVARTALKASSEVTKKLKEFFHYFPCWAELDFKRVEIEASSSICQHGTTTE